MEMALTARKLSAGEARQMGLVSQICPSKDELQASARALALKLAAKSPVAITGIKRVMQHARCDSQKRNHSLNMLVIHQIILFTRFESGD